MNLFSKRLKDLRDERDLLQEDIAGMLKVSRSTYSNWEQGRREPDIDTLIMLSSFFKVTVGYLVGVEN